MDKSEWEGAQGRAWAEEWRRTDRSFAAVTEKLLRSTRGVRFSSVLDIGCGAGEMSLAIARGHPGVRVVGVDVSPPLVEASRERGKNLANVSFECEDAATWSPPAGFAPQLLVSRHGVMFFDNPPAAFGNLASLADSGAHLLFSCFRAPALNPFFTDVVALLPASPAPPAPEAPGPFAFADRDRVHGILASGGWEGIAFDAFDFPMVVGAGEDPVADAVSYFSSIGPAARAAADMDADLLAEFRSGLAGIARRHLADGIVALPAAGWIVSARKA